MEAALGLPLTTAADGSEYVSMRGVDGRASFQINKVRRRRPPCAACGWRWRGVARAARARRGGGVG